MGTLLFVVVLLLPPVLMAWRAWRVDADRLVHRWAGAHGVSLSPETRPLVAAHLSRLARTQALWAAIGWMLSPVVRMPFAPFSGAVVGYLLASLVVELSSRRALGSGVAVLAPRRLGDYVPAAAVVALRATGVLGLALCSLAVALEERPTAFGPGRWGIFAIGAVVAGVVAVVELGARRIVSRPQPAASTDHVAVDDALRATSVHEVVASGIALALVVVAWGFAAAGGRFDVRPMGWLLGTATVLALLGAVVVWQLLSPRPWRVRRLDAVAP